MSISQIGQSISESATLKLNEAAAALRARGEPVIHLAGGEPVSSAPAAAIARAVALLETGQVRYTPADGLPALKQAVIEYTERFYGRRVTPANVVCSGGAKQALAVALQAVLDPHDEVLYPAPYWVSYPDMARLCGAVGIAVQPHDGSFQPRLQDIERRVGPRTRAVLINSPNNPSGVLYPESFIADIVEFCERRDLYLIMDDIYHRLVFDGRTATSCYDYARNATDASKLIVVNGVSKQYAMTGFRIGWAVANRYVARAMANIQGHQTSGPSTVGQHAAIGALTGPQDDVAALAATLEHNRAVLLAGLDAIARVRVQPPDGTFYCFADFSAYDTDSQRLAQHLLDAAQVLVVPGIEFGMDGHLRISFCGSPEDIAAGLSRIRNLLDGRPAASRHRDNLQTAGVES
jgi:aspartate aminotransferase